MTIRAQAADGTIHEFPAGTRPEVVDRAMRDYAQRNRNRMPATRGQSRDLLTEATQFLGEVNRNIPFADEVSAGAGAALGALRNAMTGRPADFGGEWTKQRGGQNAMSADINARRPNVAALAQGVGMAAPALIPGGQGVAVRQAGARPAARLAPAVTASRAGNMGRGAAAAAGSAAFYGAGSEGTVQERLRRATDPAALGTAAAGGAVAGRFVPARPRPSRVRPEVRTLAGEGVQMTPGQIMGGAAQRVENAMTSVPLLGDVVRNAQTRGLESFNSAAARRAARPIGGKIDPAARAGSESIADVSRQVSEAYERALPEIGVNLTGDAFAGVTPRLNDLAADMTQASRDRLGSIIDKRLMQRLDGGKMDGRTYQRVQSELRDQIGRFSTSTDADQRAIGDGLKILSEELKAVAAAQNPKFARDLAAADKAFSRVATLETAAGRAGAVDGVVTPRQLREAYRVGDKSVRRKATAQGRRADQSFYDAAATVLPSNVPDSGTAGRAMTVAAPVGVTAGLFTAPVPTIAGIGAAGMAALPYTSPGMALANKALNTRIAAEARREALERLGALASQRPELRSLYEDVSVRLSRSLGAAQAQP